MIAPFLASALRERVLALFATLLERFDPEISVIACNTASTLVMEALRWKQAFHERSDAKMAIATQFCFEADPVIAWAERLAQEGIDLPIHIGVAGPAKLQTLIKFAIACGVGSSLRVLQKRAMDVTKLLVPYEPTEFVASLAAHKAKNHGFGIESVHFFPLGGIKTNALWAKDNGGASGVPANS